MSLMNIDAKNAQQSINKLNLKKYKGNYTLQSRKIHPGNQLM